MDYELFVLQFQRRTQKRMADFEAMMREHQNSEALRQSARDDGTAEAGRAAWGLHLGTLACVCGASRKKGAGACGAAKPGPGDSAGAARRGRRGLTRE